MQYFKPDLSRIIEQNQWEITTQLAVYLQEHEHIHVGTWFQQLSNANLETLEQYIDINNLAVLMLLATLLLYGENIDITEQTTLQALDILAILITTEALDRNSWVKAIHPNWSLGSDYLNLAITL